MRLPSVRLTTVTGAWLKRVATNMAMQLLKTRGFGATRVIDGYLVKANRAAGIASALVYDPPGSVYMGYKGRMTVGSRDNYNSRLDSLDGTYDAENETGDDDVFRFFPFGDITTESFGTTAPLLPDQYYVTKKDVVRSHGLRVAPQTTTLYPLRPGGIIYSGATNWSTDQTAPGLYWDNPYVLDATDGYGLARVVDMAYLTYEYQGDAPVTASNGTLTLAVIPVVKNFDATLAEGCVHWGYSGVWFVLVESPAPLTADIDPEDLPRIVFSELWTPDEHTSSFFHNGPWLARPDFPNFDAVLPGPLRPEGMTAWDEWWEIPRPIPAGGSRPNWTDCISAVWFNGKFVVNLKVNALNGTLGPGDPPSYKTAGGSACIRFEVIPDPAELVVTEGSYEIWNSPSAYGGDPTGTPFAQWVDGVLDTNVVRCENPAVTTVVGGRLVEVFWVAEADRTDVITSGGTYRYLLDRPTAGFKVVVTSVEDGIEQPPEEWFVSFDALGYGVLGPAFSDTSGGTRINLNPPTRSYKARAMDPLFVPISDRELAWLASERWDQLNTFDRIQLCVLDVTTGVVTVRSEIEANLRTTLSNMTPCHIDCIQETRYNEDDEITLEGVLLVTAELPDTAYISRDSGRTWAEYITNLAPDGADMQFAYYIGNPLGGGTRIGRAVE